MRLKPRAFTLIELLVVIAIIAILAAILFPVFAQAKLAAKKATATSNLKQIGTAVQMYIGDYDDRFPRTMETESTGMPETVSWWAIHNYQAALEPYMKNGRGGVELSGRINGRDKVWYEPADPDRSNRFMWGSFINNGLVSGVPRNGGDIASPSGTVYSTLREKQYERVVGVSLPASPPPDTDPFWTSEYFEMDLDLWEDTADVTRPYHWSKGLAIPPCSLFPALDCNEWDERIDSRSPNLGTGNKPQFGRGQLYLFCDTHVKFMDFPATYKSASDNMWKMPE